MTNPRIHWQKRKIQSAWSIAICVAALWSAPARAGSFTSDFSADPGGTEVKNRDYSQLIDGGILKLVDLTDLIDETSGTVVVGRLPLQGSYIFPDTDAGQKIESFTISFKARVGGGTEVGAQGFSLVLANDIDTATPFRESGGTTTGLTISFDALDSPPPVSGAAGVTEGNDPGDAPGIIVKEFGRKIIAKRFDGLRTDGVGSDHAPVFVPVTVKLDADGTLDVTYNGVAVYSDVPIGYVPVSGSFAFGAGTSEQTVISRDNFWIDDLSITTTPVSGAYIASVSPGTQNVAPNATVSIDIEGLNGAAVQMEFDNKAVTPVSTPNGTLTNLRYDPGIMPGGSAHTLKLTYAGKTFTYAFQVATAPVIPASAAVPAGSVDTTTSGFKVRVHQLDATPSTSDATRAERQLAGELGPNVADLSTANADGTFDKEMINMDQDGLDAGDFNSTQGHPDDLIPGIPGSTGLSDNIALEAIGFLDLQRGAYSFGAVADDSMRVSIGAEPRDVTATRLIDIVAPGRALQPFIIDQAGIYPIRVLWSEGTGPANLELWNQDGAGTKILINNRDTSGHIRSYRQRVANTVVRPYLSRATPGPGDVNVSTRPKVELVLVDDSTTVDQASIRLSINGSAVTIPSGAITKQDKQTTIKFDWASVQLTGKSPQTFKLEFADNTGAAISREYTFTTGASTGGNLGNSVKGYWTFDKGNLSASIGRDLAYIDDTLASVYKFGVTGQGDFADVPSINGQPAHVMFMPYFQNTDADAKGLIHPRLGLKMNHTMLPNGSATAKKVNQYTVILDVLWGETGFGYGPIFQLHDLGAPGDADMFWQRAASAYGKSCCSPYTGMDPAHLQPPGEWARVVFAVDLAANPPVLAKYINGFKHADKLSDRGVIDSPFALNVPNINLFADEDNERQDMWVNAVQIREGRMSDEEVAALGGPDANGIPLPYSTWNFDNPASPLAATVGNDLSYIDDSLASVYKTGSTGVGDFVDVPDIDGRHAGVFFMPYFQNTDADAKGLIHPRLGLKALHGLTPNGSPTAKKVNQYTVIMDLLWGETGFGYGPIFQLHDLGAPGDADMFWQRAASAYGKSCCSPYTGMDPAHIQPPGQWGRVVFAVDLAANPAVLAKYINGFKHADKLSDRGVIDSPFAFNVPNINFFADEDNERQDMWVNAIQVRQGRMSDDQVAALGSATAEGIPTPNPVKGEWNFDDASTPLKATVGKDLGYIDDTLSGVYKTGITGQGDFADVPNINGLPASVLFIPYFQNTDADAKGVIHPRLGFKMLHGIGANGSPTAKKVNQYTIILDLLWGETGFGYGPIFQLHDLGAPGDADMFWQRAASAYGKSCCSPYTGMDPAHIQPPGEWARVVFAVDLSASPAVLAKYINGFKHADKLSDRGVIDSPFALNVPNINLFADEDNERQDMWVNAVQIREGRMSDEEVAALGGPSAYGIPSAPTSSGGGTQEPVPTSPKILISHVGGNISISWVSASTFTLESSAKLPATTWSAVPGVVNNSVTLQPSATAQFYRLRH